MSMHRGFTVAVKVARHALVACATTSLIASTALTPIASAFAQSTPTQGAPQAQTAAPQTQAGDSKAWPGPPITAQTAANDPPARVGRIAKMTGTVSFHTADEDQWGPATLNYPLTAGNALWTEPGARAELQIGSANRLVMDSGTELNVSTLDDSRFEAGLPQGTAYLNLSDVAAGDSYTIQTPRGSVQITEPGRYVITAGDDDTPTSVTALDGGKAQLSGRNLNQTVPAGQTATLSGPLDGDEPVKAALGAAQQNSFAQALLAEEKAAPTAQAMAAAPAAAPAARQAGAAVSGAPVSNAPARAPAAMPAQVQGMTGAQDMAAYGTWSSAPNYGSVWYPPVEAGWVPYRHGHWAYIPPWGWTWVADEPWGFAPFHYGRWVMVHDRWAWSPGYHHKRHRHYRPVYAPALVAFFGTGSGLSISITAGNVGWVPLGWHEPYYPPYRVSRTYIRNVNVTHVTNITRVTNVTNVNTITVNRYVNRNSATVVSADAMRRSQPVQRAVQTVNRGQIDNARIDRRARIEPTSATAGMSPQTIQRMGMRDDGDAARRAHAPGPQIRQNDPRPTDLRRDSRSQPMATVAPQQQPRQDSRRQAGSAIQDNGVQRNGAHTLGNSATGNTPAPRPMTREQAAQPGNARSFEQGQRAQPPAEQRNTARGSDERPQAQPRPQVRSEPLPQQPSQQQRAVQDQQRQAAERQQQESQRQNARRQQEQAQRQQQEMQRQHMERQNLERQRQDQQRQQLQQQSQRQQDMQRQQIEQQARQQQEMQRQQAQQQREVQQRQQDVQPSRQQEARRQQPEVPSDSPRQRRRDTAD